MTTRPLPNLSTYLPDSRCADLEGCRLADTAEATRTPEDLEAFADYLFRWGAYRASHYIRSLVPAAS